MNSEGQNVVSGAPQTPPAASPVPPAQAPVQTPADGAQESAQSSEQPASEQAPVAQQAPASAGSTNKKDDYIVVGDAARARKNTKRTVVIIASILAGLALVGGVTFLLINLAKKSDSNINNLDNKSSDDIITEMQDIFEAPEEDENADFDDDDYNTPDDDAEGLIAYMDEFTRAYEAGELNLTKEEAAQIYSQAALNLSDYCYTYGTGKGRYSEKVLEYYYRAEDLLYSIDTALDIYLAENTYGSKENSEKYKQIAIERGSKAFEEDPNGSL